MSEVGSPHFVLLTSYFELPTSFAEKLSVLFLLQIVDASDVVVGNLLDFFQSLLLVVLRDFVVLEKLLQAIVGISPYLADAVATLLAQLVDVLRELLAALLGERRQGNADDFAVVGWIQAET